MKSILFFNILIVSNFCFGQNLKIREKNIVRFDSLSAEIKKDPYNADNYYLRSKVGARAGKLDDVILQDINFAISLADSSKYYVHRADFYSTEKDYRNSLKDAEFAIQLGHHTGKVYKLLGESELNLGMLEKSVVSYTKAIEIIKTKIEKDTSLQTNKKRIVEKVILNITLTDCYAGLGRAFSNLRKDELAIYNFNQMFLSSKSFYEENVFLCWANSCLHLGDFMGAMKYSNKVLENNAKSGIAYALKGYSKAQLEDFRGGIAEYDLAILNTPLNSENLTLVATYHFMKAKLMMALYTNDKGEFNIQKYNELVQELNIAIDLNPKLPEYYFHRGVALLNLRDINKGCLDFSRAGDLGYEEAYTYIKKHCNN